MKNKNLFIIPGFGDSFLNKSYEYLLILAKKKEYNIYGVPIDWKYKTLNEYTKQFETFYNKHKGKSNTVLGFSYGAAIAFITATYLKPDVLILCSLSQTFKEDFDALNKHKVLIIKSIGKKRWISGNSFEARKIAEKITSKTTILYGELEAKHSPQLEKRSLETSTLIKNVTLIKIKDTPHIIDSIGYQKTLAKII